MQHPIQRAQRRLRPQRSVNTQATQMSRRARVAGLFFMSGLALALLTFASVLVCVAFAPAELIERHAQLFVGLMSASGALLLIGLVGLSITR